MVFEIVLYSEVPCDFKRIIAKVVQYGTQSLVWMKKIDRGNLELNVAL